MVRLRIGIVLFDNSPAEVERLARSLAASELGREIQVEARALDNSAAATIEPVVTALLGRGAYRWTGANRGYGATHNAGMREAFSAGADGYLCLNPDAVLHPRCLRELWATANPDLAGTSPPAATVMDAAIHQERTAPIEHGSRSCISIDHMPDGVFVTDDEHIAYLVVAGQLLRWSPAGYDRPTTAIQYPARVLTPGSVVRTLAAGYSAGLHDSALAALT